MTVPTSLLIADEYDGYYINEFINMIYYIYRYMEWVGEIMVP